MVTNNSSFEILPVFRRFCYKVLPTVYTDALSYAETQDKIIYLLNQLIDNNNMIPDMIVEAIKEYITSGVISDALKELLAGVLLNVKYPPKGVTPAVGDGVADDTKAFNEILAYAAVNCACVYVEPGVYILEPFTIPAGVSLYGGCYKGTRLAMKGGTQGNFVTMQANSVLAQINVDCVKGNKTAAVNGVSAGDGCQLENVMISNCYTGATILTNCNANLMSFQNNTPCVVSGSGNTVRLKGGAVQEESGTLRNTIVDDSTTKISNTNVVLNPANPLAYRTPTKLNNKFNSVPFKDYAGANYDVLVYNGMPGDDYINVLDYGAVGDGQTDCTSAFNKAIDALNSSNDTVMIIPQGIYVITQELNPILGTNAKRITGGGTISANFTGNVFVLGSPTDKCWYFTFDHVGFTTSLRTQPTAFYARNINYCVIEQITCLYFKTFIDIDVTEPGVGLIVQNVLCKANMNFINNETCNINGIYIRRCEVDGNSMTNSTFYASRGSQFTDTVVMSDCLVQTMDYGIVLNSPEVQHYFSIVNCVFDGMAQYTLLANMKNYVNRIHISNCWIDCENNEAMGALAFVATGPVAATNKAVEITIENNIFIQPFSRAIYIDNGQAVTISGNQIVNACKANENRYPIDLSNCKQVSVVGNFIGNTEAFATAQTRYGVNVESTCDYVLISDNDFSTLTETTPANRLRLLGANKIVANNLGYNDAT